MHNDDESIIDRAVRAARGISWTAEYSRWADRWLDGTDRTGESAASAKARIWQWSSLGVNDGIRALHAAAQAAETGSIRSAEDAIFYARRLR